MLSQLLNKPPVGINGQIEIKIADNKGVIIESYENSSLAGKQTAVLVAMQSLKAQAMAKAAFLHASNIANSCEVLDPKEEPRGPTRRGTFATNFNGVRELRCLY